MKTYWDYLPAFVIVFMLPFLVGAVPTVELNNHFLGGGPVRQYVINLVCEWLPVETSHQMVTAFMQANAWGEYAIYAPIALNMSLVLMWCTALAAYSHVSAHNWFFHQKYQSTRKAAK